MKLNEQEFNTVIDYLLESISIGINLSKLKIQKYHPDDLKSMIKNERYIIDDNMYLAYSPEKDTKLTAQQILFLKQCKPVCFDMGGNIIAKYNSNYYWFDHERDVEEVFDLKNYKNNEWDPIQRIILDKNEERSYSDWED